MLGIRSSDDLPKGNALLLESLGGGIKTSDEPQVTRRSFISSAGYHVQIVSKGSETDYFYPWDSETGRYRRCRCATHSSKSNGFSSMNQKGTSASASASANHNYSSNLGSRPHQGPSNFRKSSPLSRKFTQSHKEHHPTMRISPSSNNHQFGKASNGPRNDYGFTSLQSYKDNKVTDVSKKIVCGPRALGICDSVKKSEMEDEDELPYFARKKNFNLHDFQTEYENAKLYIIKYFGEDNVRKSIKYGVCSRTHHGMASQKQLIMKRKRSPLKQVNRSRQFVGVAEMTGRVDFSKDLDFLQLDKWSGFFPLKWHILKDVLHSELRGIILKENDNRAVTYTRDTQEIGLCQGTETLKIFEKYSAKTCLLDDLSFYENRQKLRVAERNSKAEKLKSEKHTLETYQVTTGLAIQYYFYIPGFFV